MTKPMYALLNGEWVLVSGARPHAHPTANVSDFGSYPNSHGQTTAKIPTTDGADGWTYEGPEVGQGIAAGGTSGQTLTKQNSTNFNTTWGQTLINAAKSFDFGVIVAETPVIITHNLGTRDIAVSVVEKTVAGGGEANGQVVEAAISITSENTISLTFGSAAPADTYRVRIIANGSSIIGAKDVRVQDTQPTNAQVGTLWLVPYAAPLSTDYAMFGSTNTANMILLGSASNTSTFNTVITSAGGQAGGAFLNTKITIANWSKIVATWTMDVTGGGADGGAFVLLNTANYASNPALGSGGGDIALISGQMFAVEYRTFSSDGLWIMPNGSGLHAVDTTYRNDWSGSHTYEVTVLSSGITTVKLDGATIHTGTYAIPSQAWVGLIGGTGGSSEVRTVSSGTISLWP